MFDILLQKKKVILMNEVSTSPSLPGCFDFSFNLVYKDPIEREIQHLKKEGDISVRQGNLNIQRIILKGFANMPELFNKITVCQDRGESCSSL
ncbi:MAG TPA: hypothetical protein PKJ08_11020 [Candidatus Cloacimonadota bacterium]|nr:hypothetical protein [Candidatus Cloacimonadota bacterium]HOD55050.1 hypothetical protein [Candidatus Cloacimonadota bacterium]HPM00801.1 hypothetical protein [Candidatus Cloacimonadota bacterium]